mgnify:FL=1
MSQQIEFEFVQEESARVLGSLEERQIEAVVQLMAQMIVSVWESGKEDDHAE